MSFKIDNRLAWWTVQPFQWVPAQTAASDLAIRLMAIASQLGEPAELAKALGMQLHFRGLGAARGGFEALLLPGTRSSFDIICDPATIPGGHSVPFRIAHEIAHSRFYRWDSKIPSRTRSASAEEERFCDVFASTLTLSRT